MIDVLTALRDFVWGWPLMIGLVGTGFFLTLRLRGLQFRKLGLALWMARPGAPQDEDATGDISNFQALMTALSATVGTGNIAGVATAVAVAGPGALFWMWITGLLGMITKYCEAALAVEYRVQDETGEMNGGPMYYISRGLGWKPLAVLFSVFTIAASLVGIGNMVQSNSIAHSMEASFGVAPVVTGVVLMVATGLVLLGGIQSIGKVAGVIVPLMIGAYILCALYILVVNAGAIPGAFGLIFKDAFTPTAAVGGFLGATVMMAMREGFSKGLFSNESGLGSAPIAAAAARTSHPIQQALISMTQTFIDTLVVCTLTGLVLIVSGCWKSGQTGAALTTLCFDGHIRGGRYVVSIGLLLFAWTTMLGWSYYGERALEFLAGDRASRVYRGVFVLLVGVGAVMEVDVVWLIGDICNAFMALPNLIGLLALSPVVVRLTKDYFARLDEPRPG